MKHNLCFCLILSFLHSLEPICVSMHLKTGFNEPHVSYVDLTLSGPIDYLRDVRSHPTIFHSKCY